MASRLPKHAPGSRIPIAGALLAVLAISSAAVAARPGPEVRTWELAGTLRFPQRRSVPLSNGRGASTAGVLADDGFAGQRLFAPGQRLAVAGAGRSAGDQQPAGRARLGALLFGFGGALVAFGGVVLLRQKKGTGCGSIVISR